MPALLSPYLMGLDFRAGVDFSGEEYFFGIPAVRDLPGIEFHPSVTFFVGENGSGKSTILEAIALAYGFSPEGGTRNVRLQTTREASTSSLNQSLQLIRGMAKPSDGYFLRAESFFNVATYMDEEIGTLGYGEKMLHAQSHGEAFMALFVNKLCGNGIYFFDEPEAALSPQRQLAALRVIHQLVMDSSQLVIATHSSILLAYPNAKIIRFDEDGLTEVTYEETEHYQITRDFLNHYPRRLEQIFENSNDD